MCTLEPTVLSGHVVCNVIIKKFNQYHNVSTQILIRAPAGGSYSTPGQ